MTTPTELRALLAEAREYVDKKHTHYVALSGSEGTVVKLDCERCDLLARIADALSEKDEGGWLPIETAPKGKTVLVHYKNQLGNGRTMRACYYIPETLESDTEESGWADEGWYEQSEAYEYLMPLDGDHTHWQPLPPLPERK
mgnify:FL=1